MLEGDELAADAFWFGDLLNSWAENWISYLDSRAGLFRRERLWECRVDSTCDVSVFVSGPESAWSKVKPVTQTFSKSQSYLGNAEQAPYMKLVANAIIVSTAQATAEALALGRKAGLEWGDS